MNLNSDWLLRCEELSCGPECAAAVMVKNEDWLPAVVPGDIREPLLTAGLIKEPLEGLNCFASEWVENKSWWYLKHFTVDEAFLSHEVIELVLESVDYGADIFLNGHHLGLHLSSFYPFRREAGKYLQIGDNTLLIRLSAGLERVNPDDMQPYNMTSEEERRPGRGDKRKGFLRKPQYSFGWDWQPRVASCGIMKDVWLEGHRQAAIRWAHTQVKSLEPDARLQFLIEIENFHPFATLDADLQVVISLDGAVVAVKKTDLLLRSGINPVEVELTVAGAELWWPNGMGGQPLYQAEIALSAGELKIDYPAYQFGIRTVELDQSGLQAGNRLFAFKINGVQTFCKGGDWIPADSLYGRISDSRYTTLVQEARQAGFNMFRIWGGGLYERDIFYQLCDRYGIMLWHDFMFACSEYPDDQEWFARSVENELDYQTRHLGNHPAIVLWCGNNENTWGFSAWWPNTGYYGARIYNYLAPAAVRRNCPEIPYWNSSPYGGAEPNSSEIGDRHHWGDCMMSPDMMKRIVPEEYDRVTAKFISEYGYIGPSKRSSVERYFDGAPLDITSEIWRHHTNTFEKDTVLAGIKYHYIDPEKLDIDRYLLYAGLCQGVMYGYSLEAFRFKEQCWGGLFWMYNDCWGETGWTIIDYYLSRKISYYFVKRALAPVKLIMRAEEGQIKVVGINERAEPEELLIEFGYRSFDGRTGDTRQALLTLGPRSRQCVLTFAKGQTDDQQGLYYVRTMCRSDIPTAFLRTGTFRQMAMPPAAVKVLNCEPIGNNLIVTLKTDTFAHAVHFNLADEIKLSDDYFDLLPEECRQVILYDVPGIDPDTICPVAVNGLSF
ncbi:MAG: beta-mannosidase [Clostridiaceae bacterium]|nr:beta-mannosidase [Clostridiaceae bacterium]